MKFKLNDIVEFIAFILSVFSIVIGIIMAHTSSKISDFIIGFLLLIFGMIISALYFERN